MSSSKMEFKKSTKYTPKTSARTTIIQRTTQPAYPEYGAGSTMRRSTMRMSTGPASFGAGVVAAAANDGVQGVKVHREHEKKEMQGLNERFAGLVEKARFADAQNQQLLLELENLRKRKDIDIEPIKDMYEKELEAARECIDALGKEKGELDAALAGQQEEVQEERANALEANKIADDLRNDIDKLTMQVGNLEGDLSATRMTNEQLKKEIKSLRDTNQRLQNDLRRLRTDLDNETAAHLGCAARAQTLEEEIEFMKEIHAKEIEELKKLNNPEQRKELEDIWQGNIQKAIMDIQRSYDDQLNLVRNDMEMKFESQLRDLRAGSNRGAVESETIKEEVKRQKLKSSDLAKKCGELEAENARLRSMLNESEKQISSLTKDFDDLENKSREEIAELRLELENCLTDLQSLSDAKQSLELEIGCYRALLEGEESRVGLKSITEKFTDSRSVGGQQLADIISSSSFSGESAAKMVVQKRAKGIIAINDASAEGKYVTLENSSSGVRKKDQDMFGYKLKRSSKTGTAVEFLFKEHFVLCAGKSVKIFAKGSAPSDAQLTAENNLKTDFYSWPAGPGECSLYDENDLEKSTYIAKIQQ